MSEAKKLLSHDVDGKLQFYRVGRQVNSSTFEGGEETIAPIDMRTACGL